MTKSTYRLLQERLDLYSMGFPPTQSGIEIKILKYLFTEQDAVLFLALSPALESPDIISDRIHKPLEETAAHLDQMAEKGLLFRLKKGTTHRYGAIPFVHGLFEFQVKTLKPDLAKMVGDYFDEAFDQAMQKNAKHFLRVIPVNKSIDLTHHVASYEDAVQILSSKDAIVVAECICRKRTRIIDQGCGKPLEACFMFGSMGQYYLDKKMGRQISLDEAIEILKDCREAGLVTQPATAQNPSGMCNCCGDCCGVLGAIGKHPAPASIVFSNHIVTMTENECSGCELCLERCQMDALTLNEDGKIGVAENRCIGCGLCVTTCPVEALKLIDKPDKELRIPPESMGEQMMKMAKSRGIL
ncbi:MAG: 4Fe-4S dicluster domain-containing protein [Proteobacteria bacterium]|nr:4Fe-4S dicluster domain-containing protein [Desulfobacula sp.]MBU3954346.1 4Fe-4S dicluster domain-containing protein [Pseudomonadota bacterium]MBU4132764.1 4Fe-4S dicluster domain-containing protein [Pseudomonadota bacterium]